LHAPTLEKGPPPALEGPGDVLSKAARENFPVALRILPPQRRRGLEAIYGFARLVDDAGDLAEGNRLALLDWIEADLDRGGTHSLTEAAQSLPREPLRRLLEANRQDQRVSRYETFAELVAYCHLSADPVGELVLDVFEAATPERTLWSDRVCTALQLAEHWQDVGEDYGCGRVYLPQEDLRRFGVSEDDLADSLPGERFTGLMAFEVERARRLLLEGGTPLVSSLQGWAKLAVAGYVGGGLAALDAIARSGYDVLRRSPRAGRAARTRATLRILWVAR
jgi:squalene synthase HpnC